MTRSDQAILDRLENKAVHYLGRYASTAQRLELVLSRFARRKLADEDPDRLADLISRKVEECRARGYVDDRAFAEARSTSLRRQGASINNIRRKLAERGVDRDVITDVIDAQDTSDDAELRAALIHAKRRRLGPYANADNLREGWQSRHLGSLARAGFSSVIARRVMAFDDIDSVEAWLAEQD